MVKIKSAIIINGIFESQKNIFSGQFFAENRQFQTPGFEINHTRIKHNWRLREVHGLLRGNEICKLPRPLEGTSGPATGREGSAGLSAAAAAAT
jgi:hypothetical protein